jgi:hypothetical protein
MIELESPEQGCKEKWLRSEPGARKRAVWLELKL